MQGMTFTIAVHLHGTLAANATGNFILPCAAHLVAISASASNAASSTLEVGTSADRDGIIDALTVGVSNTPIEWTPTHASWAGALVTAGGSGYKFAKGDILAWDLDFDGAAGTAGQNVSILFTFREG